MRLRFAPDVRISLSPELEVQLSCGVGQQRRTAVLKNPVLLRWVLEVGTGRVDPIDHAVTALGRDPDAARAMVADLVARRVFVPVDDPSRVRAWPPVAATLHDATIDLVFESTAEAADNQTALVAELHSEPNAAPPPPNYRDFTGPRTACRGSADPLRELVVDVFGVVEEFDFAPWGPHFLRTSPSLGARHAIDGFVVDATGSYAIDVRAPELVRRSEGDLRERIRAACPGLPPAPAYISLAIHWPRFMWKYRRSRYYTMALQDLGHLWASLEIAAHVRGLGVVADFDLDEVGVASLLGLDPYIDTPMCVVSVG